MFEDRYDYQQPLEEQERQQREDDLRAEYQRWLADAAEQKEFVEWMQNWRDRK